ncbi:MAG TPA: hypothetical protein VE956_13585 [Nodularia sp. (in: cyanobacteria)]|nr:hypothetical protein [Nodularia sp. (in: cyanobacteria)]
MGAAALIAGSSLMFASVAGRLPPLPGLDRAARSRLSLVNHRQFVGQEAAISPKVDVYPSQRTFQ